MSNSIPASSTRYAICRYPTTLIDIWRNKRGEQFILRPVLPQDKPLLEAFYASLSPLSRRLRFHGAVNALSQDSLSAMSEIDYDKHLALVVTYVHEGHPWAPRIRRMVVELGQGIVQGIRAWVRTVLTLSKPLLERAPGPKDDTQLGLFWVGRRTHPIESSAQRPTPAIGQLPHAFPTRALTAG
jgi:hypothetical protein